MKGRVTPIGRLRAVRWGRMVWRLLGAMVADYFAFFLSRGHPSKQFDCGTGSECEGNE